MKITVTLAIACVVGQEYCVRPTTAFVAPSIHSTSTSSTRSSHVLFLDRLAEEGDWAAYLDEDKTGLVYYYNSETGESLWEPPTNTFPNVRLNGAQLEVAVEKRRAYREALNPQEEKEQEESSGGAGFFASFMEDTTSSATTASSAVAEQEEVAEVEDKVEETTSTGNWFDGIFDGGDKKDIDTPIVVEEDTEEVVLVEKEKKAVDAKPAFSFGNFFSSGDDGENEEATYDIVAEGEVIVEETKKSTTPKPFFNVFGSGGNDADTVVDEVEENVEEEYVEEVQEKKKSSIFGIFGGGESKNAAVVEEEVIEELPEEVEAKPFFGNVFGGIKGSYLAEPKLDEPAVEPAVEEEEEKVVVVSRPTFSLLPQKKLVEEFVEEEEGVFVAEEEEPLKLDISSTVIPHPQKMSWGGEDAAFVSGRTFGVFDGVSGATKAMGVPLYSKVMSSEMKKRVGKEGLYAKDIENLMTEVAELADAKATGATTAVVASITEDGYLRAVNLGDSGCIVIRNDVIVSRTKDCVHYFDCPYQLSVDSPDRPKNSRKLNVEVKPGDTILMASDGVFDNLSDQVICEEVSKNPKDKASKIASRVAKLSRKISLDKYAVTPYAAAARRNGNPAYKNGVGGKIDDTSCIVVRCQ